VERRWRLYIYNKEKEHELCGVLGCERKSEKELKSNPKESKKEREESWPWQAWLDGRRTLSFHHPGHRFSSQV